MRVLQTPEYQMADPPLNSTHKVLHKQTDLRKNGLHQSSRRMRMRYLDLESLVWVKLQNGSYISHDATNSIFSFQK